jgi:hypothetical protein
VLQGEREENLPIHKWVGRVRSSKGGKECIVKKKKGDSKKKKKQKEQHAHCVDR